MSQKRRKNIFDIEKGGHDIQTIVEIESASGQSSKQTAWFQDEREGSFGSRSIQSQDIGQEASENEEETSFISSPIEKVTSKQSRRRIVKGSPVESVFGRNSPDGVSTSRKDKSPSPASSLTQRNKGRSSKKISVQDTVEPLIKDDTEAKDVTSISSRRHSFGDSSAEGSRSFTPLSDTRSYRDRLRDRFQAVRERAGTSVVETHSRSRLRRRRLNQPSVSRFDDLLHKEEAQVGEALERHEQARAKWKEVIDAVQEGASSEAAFDFFTQVYEEEEEDDGKEQEDQPHVAQASPSSPQGSEEIGSSDEQTKLVTADLLGLRDEWELVQTVAPVYLREQQESREREIYFCPSMGPLSVEEKLKPEHELRYPEEEGLYVGNRLKVADRNRNKLEHRLAIGGDRKWFGDDGDLLMLPDPRRSLSMRPPVFDEINPHLDVEYKPAAISDFENKYIVQPGERAEDDRYLLEIDICSLSFTHHPLFGREHVLAQQVTDLFLKYNHRAALGQHQRLSGRLEALRRARDSLKKALDQTSDANQQQLERLERYVAEIRETRRLRQIEGYNDRQLLSKLLMKWRDLKRLRELQGYTCTSLRLRIHKEYVENPVAERKTWDEEIRKEIEELEEEYHDEYNKQLDEYTKKLSLWRKRRKAVRDARKEHQKQAEQKIERESEERQEKEKEKMLEELETPGEEPKPPAKVDMAVVKSEMMERLTESFRPPGEPKLNIELTNNGHVDQNPGCPNEQQRRAAVKRCELYVKIFYNQKEVCCSRPQALGPRFNVSIGQLFPIRILQWPESLKVELHEEGGTLTHHVIAEIYIPIPSSDTTLQNCSVEHHEFSSSQVLTFSHAAVGSGSYICPFPEGSNKEPICLNTSGVLTCRVGWGVDTILHGDGREKILAPPEKYWTKDRRDSCSTDLMTMLVTEGAMDIEKLREWAEKSQLDPNDPNNAAFFYFIKNAGVGLNTEPNYFRLDPLQSEFDFCKMEDLEMNPRLRLLRLRDQGEPEFRGLRLVPLREKEIPKDVFKVYEKRLTATEPKLESLSSDPLESHRDWGQRFLQKVRQRVLKQCRLAQQHHQLQDIVMEDQVPDIGTLGLTFMKWLQPKRPLRPTRKERKKVTMQNLAGQEVKIIVNVIHAFEVPVRKDVDALSSSVGGTAGQQGVRFSMVPVRPFVEVSFQGISVRTTAAEGANPTWNQELQLPLKPPSGDYSPGTLQSIEDNLYLHLFDEIVVDLLEDDRLRDTNVHHRLERNWLGSLQIEGTFKLYSPPVLLGYEKEPHHRQFSSSFTVPGDTQQVLPPRDAIFLTVFITVQPALNPPEPFKEKLESSELSFVEEHLENWESQIASQVAHRKVKTLVIDISGKSVCVTRFFRPLAPPVLVEDEPVTEEMAARFVSMIPMVGGSTLFPGLFDIWLTSDQVLRLLSGDSEDHAVLLCCYLMHMGKKAWLLLGSGIPHGPTAYVLAREEDQTHNFTYWLWDPASGQKYNIQDNFCPLQKVYCLINDENIWVNLQKEELPWRTRFDITRRSDWWPAFGRNVGAPMGSVQPAVLEYTVTSLSATQLLQDRIEKTLKDSLMKWRRTARTLWNRYCIAILRKLLPTLEHATWNQKNLSLPDHIQELQHILGSHKMCGFPINLPYTNMEAITEAMRATGVHYNESPEVEFALAVYIHPFPNNVLSVWVYVASLIKRR